MSRKSHRSIQQDGELPYFYVPDIAETCQLSEEESNHAVRVLRLKSGDGLRITDGRGRLYEGILGDEHPKRTLVSNLRVVEASSPDDPKLHLAIAPTKSMDRIEMVLEKLTEVGLGSFHVVITERAIRRKVNTDRLHKVMVAAMKQSMKLNATDIFVHSSLSELMEASLPPCRYIAYCGDEASKVDLRDLFVPDAESLYLIGPEGDFTPEEVEIALQHDFRAVALGEERLRTETAGLYAGMLHHILNHQKNGR